MRRRDIIAGLGSAAAWPLMARAQRTKLPTIGLFGTATASVWKPWVEAFRRRLDELGWIEGRTVSFEYRWGGGRSERFAQIAAELVALKVDVIVTGQSTVSALKQARSIIPTVLVLATDPIGTGMVASLAHPGGNVTGLSLQAPDLVGKRLELLREVVPHLHRVAVLANVGYPAAVLEMHEMETTARSVGLDVVRLEIRRAEDIAPAFEAHKGSADALYLTSDALLNTNRILINTLANSARLPTIGGIREIVEAGSLMSYGPNFADLFRRAADYVDKILRGAKPGDLPIEQPTKFDFIINLSTAKALGLSLPPTLLDRADEVIE
ncbi:MAG TPA: ABC transporter substrate-binding protein [Pseudolabrys sp.]|nr:ABC transporter substrate-binding protein [Pseudolabrys sp.]